MELKAAAPATLPESCCSKTAACCPPSPLTLQDAISFALEHQPNVTAARYSLASAQTAEQALNKMCVASIISREMQYRKEQAKLGVGAAWAGVDRAERDTTYAVTRLYYSVLYARAQAKVTSDVVQNLIATLDTAKGLLKGGSRDITQDTVDKIVVYRSLALTRKYEAERGISRAEAALREAIGVGPECPLTLASTAFTAPMTTVNKDDIVALAISRRPEITQSVLLSKITCIEKDAQGTHLFAPTVRTFAAGADIHSSPVPPTLSNGEYRPGGLLPEMPVMLAGKRADRVARADDLYDRSTSVVDKTRNLITLDAEDAYYKWYDYSRRSVDTKAAADLANKLAENTRGAFRDGQKVKAEDVTTNQVIAAQALAAHNEAIYWLILSLADLERVTAGGFSSGLGAPK
jgi:outer membrane protein TolC